jgi:hypothetical protein
LPINPGYVFINAFSFIQNEIVKFQLFLNVDASETIISSAIPLKVLAFCTPLGIVVVPLISPLFPYPLQSLSFQLEVNDAISQYPTRLGSYFERFFPSGEMVVMAVIRDEPLPLTLLSFPNTATYPLFVKTTSTPLPLSCTGCKLPLARSIPRVSPLVFGDLLL